MSWEQTKRTAATELAIATGRVQGQLRDQAKELKELRKQKIELLSVLLSYEQPNFLELVKATLEKYG